MDANGFMFVGVPDIHQGGRAFLVAFLGVAQRVPRLAVGLTALGK